LQLNPNGVVPTLVHDGRVIIESTLIIEYLDESFPDPPLMPSDPFQRAQVRLWMKKIDDYLHAACSTVTFAIAFRQGLLKRTPEELEARFKSIPDPAYRERQRLSVTQGSPRRMLRLPSRITTNTSARWKQRSAGRLILSAKVTRWRTWQRLRTSIAPRW
jgi:Glutathione S-transferase, N-terminal domain